MASFSALKLASARAKVLPTDVRAAVEEMRGRGVEFEEYDTPETRTENGIAQSLVEAWRRGSRTRKATWSALFQPELVSEFSA